MNSLGSVEQKHFVTPKLSCHSDFLLPGVCGETKFMKHGVYINGRAKRKLEVFRTTPARTNGAIWRITASSCWKLWTPHSAQCLQTWLCKMVDRQTVEGFTFTV